MSTSMQAGPGGSPRNPYEEVLRCWNEQKKKKIMASSRTVSAGRQQHGGLQRKSGRWAAGSCREH